MNMVQQEISAKAIQSAVVDLRNDAFDAILKVDMSFILYLKTIITTLAILLNITEK